MDYSDGEDAIDSDLEASLYSQIHHDGDNGTQVNTQPVNKTYTVESTVTANKNIFPVITKIDTLKKRLLKTSSRTKHSSRDDSHNSRPKSPFVDILKNQELIAEKRNRKKPAETITSQSMTYSASPRKKILPAKRKRIRDPSLSSEDGIFSSSAPAPKEVVINISSTSDDSCVVVDENNPTSGKQNMWQLCIEDRYKIRDRSKDYMRIECFNCKERGHLSRSCTKPKRLSCCFLCGEPGHSGERCRNPFCSKCLQPGHEFEQCQWGNETVRCCYCSQKGHLWQECPLHWRRYHLTTVPGRIITISEFECQMRNEPVYCYNCGGVDHHGFACTRKRIHGFIYPADRRVINYRDPSYLSQLDTNKIYQKRWEKKLLLTETANRSAMFNLNSPMSTPRSRPKPKSKIAQLKEKLNSEIKTCQNKLLKRFPRGRKVKIEGRTNFLNTVKTKFPKHSKKMGTTPGGLFSLEGLAKVKRANNVSSKNSNSPTKKQRRKRNKEERKTSQGMHRLIGQFL